LPLWAASLVVGVGMLLLAGLLGSLGAGEIKRGTQTMSNQAIGRLKRDVEAVKESAKR
jgi:hypothetical protein